MNQFSNRSVDQILQKRIKITDRSKKRIRAIFGEIFKFGQITQNQALEIDSRGNQKLLIPYDKGKARGLARSSRIRGGFEGEEEEHDERTPTRYKSGFSRGPGSTHPIESPREKD